MSNSRRKRVRRTFFIQGKGWTTADLLENGDISPTWAGLKKSDGVVEKEVVFSSSQDMIFDSFRSLIVRESLAVIDIEVIEEETTVYNFEVEDDHTYFVTDAEVWVHNAGGYKVQKSNKSVSNPIGQNKINKQQHERAQENLDKRIEGSSNKIKDGYIDKSAIEDGTPPKDLINAKKEMLANDEKKNVVNGGGDREDPDRMEYQTMSKDQLEKRLNAHKNSQWADIQWSYGMEDTVSPLIEQKSRQQILDKYSDKIQNDRLNRVSEKKIDRYLSDLKQFGEIPQQHRPPSNRWIPNYNLSDTEEKIIRINAELKDRETAPTWKNKYLLRYVYN